MGIFVVVRIWDEWCMIVLLQWFIENFFENWIYIFFIIFGMVFLWLDFVVLMNVICVEFECVCQILLLWDKCVCVMYVIDISECNMQICLLVLVWDLGLVFDLCCQICEYMIGFIVSNYLEVLFCLCVEVLLCNWLEVLDIIIDGVLGEKVG